MGRAEQLRECNAALREGLLAFADRIYPPPSAGASQEPITKVPPPPTTSCRAPLRAVMRVSCANVVSCVCHMRVVCVSCRAVQRPRAVEEGPPPPYASLRETLAELLDAAQKREKTTKATKTTKKDASDGWVEMTSEARRLWPHYVELLLRAGIAQKHPKDSSLLRLRHYTAQ